MKKILPILVLLQSCISSTPLVINTVAYNSIPNGARKITVQTQLQSDSLYKLTIQQYATMGCPIKSNKEAMQVICDGLATTHSGTIYMLSTISGSKVITTGQSQLSADQERMVGAISGLHNYQSKKEPIIFTTKRTNANYHFQYMVKLSLSLPGIISYSN